MSCEASFVGEKVSQYKVLVFDICYPLVKTTHHEVCSRQVSGSYVPSCGMYAMRGFGFGIVRIESERRVRLQERWLFSRSSQFRA